MSGLKEIVDKMKAIFETYAGQQGSKDSLSKKELRALLSKEILGELQVKSSYNFATMSGLIEIMDKMKAIFEKYAGQEGSKDTLSKKELRALLSKELFGEHLTKEEATMYLAGLDHDGDSAVDFKEFMIFVAGLMMIIHSSLN
ncbi:hypothetical protein INR49_011980 [Caranx melampygus]|nr:hypothetical protein INR49_011980 [Caranx melampygus]